MSLDKLKQKVNQIDKRLSLKAPFELADDWVENEIKVKKNPMSICHTS